MAMVDAEDGLERELSLPAARTFTPSGWASVAPRAPDDAIDRLAGRAGRLALHLLEPLRGGAGPPRLVRLRRRPAHRVDRRPRRRPERRSWRGALPLAVTLKRLRLAPGPAGYAFPSRLRLRGRRDSPRQRPGERVPARSSCRERSAPARCAPRWWRSTAGAAPPPRRRLRAVAVAELSAPGLRPAGAPPRRPLRHGLRRAARLGAPAGRPALDARARQHRGARRGRRPGAARLRPALAAAPGRGALAAQRAAGERDAARPPAAGLPRAAAAGAAAGRAGRVISVEPRAAHRGARRGAAGGGRALVARARPELQPRAGGPGAATPRATSARSAPRWRSTATPTAGWSRPGLHRGPLRLRSPAHRRHRLRHLGARCARCCSRSWWLGTLRRRRRPARGPPAAGPRLPRAAARSPPAPAVAGHLRDQRRRWRCSAAGLFALRMGVVVGALTFVLLRAGRERRPPDRPGGAADRRPARALPASSRPRTRAASRSSTPTTRSTPTGSPW